MEKASRQALTYYLLATPLFAILDFAAGANIRLSALIPAGGRLIYYAAAFAAGVVMFKWPASATGVAALEAAANLAILVLGLWFKYFGLLSSAVEGEVAPNPFTASVIINALLSGTVLAIAAYRRLATFEREMKG